MTKLPRQPTDTPVLAVSGLSNPFVGTPAQADADLTLAAARPMRPARA